MNRLTVPNISFNTKETVNITGNNIICTYSSSYKKDTRTEHEKFFGMSEEEIYKKYGLCFTKTKYTINGKVQYKIDSDFEAELWLIKKGFVKYVRGRKVWQDEALEQGWENAWTPPKNYKGQKMGRS